jgi:hypothetical protein
MSEDIVKWLRGNLTGCNPLHVGRDAADEIERLRADLAAERERVKHLERVVGCHDLLKQNAEALADNDRLRAALAAAKAEIEAVREGGMCALSIAEEDHAHTKVALTAERERAEFYHAGQHTYQDRLEDAEAELAAERERTTKLREALEPFAKAAENFDDFPIKDAEQWFAYSGTSSQKENGKGAITVGDLRRARAVLKETEK